MMAIPRRPWKLQEIDKLTTSHRLRWADIDGSGHKVLVDTPLTGAERSAARIQGPDSYRLLPPGRMETSRHQRRELRRAAWASGRALDARRYSRQHSDRKLLRDRPVAFDGR